MKKIEDSELLERIYFFRYKAISDALRHTIHTVNNRLDEILCTFEDLIESKEQFEKLEEKYGPDFRKAVHGTSAELKKLAKRFCDPRQLTIEKYQIADLVTSLENSLKSKVRRANVKLTVNPMQKATVVCNFAAFTEALGFLFDNAIDAAIENPRSTINVFTKTEGNKTTIFIENEGIPTIEDTEIIFEPFVTSKDDPTHLGIGLNLAKDYFDSIGGEISCESDGEITTFSVVIPTH